MTTAMKSATKDKANLVVFRYGSPASPTTLRLTDWSTNLINKWPSLGGEFTSLPSMDVELPKNSGTLNDADCKINLPVSLEFARRISNGEPHSAVRVWCLEYLKNPRADGKTLTHFVGDVGDIERNPDGKPDRVLLTCKTWKKQCGQHMGIPIVRQCINFLGDERCKINLVPLKETATITAVEGMKVTIAGLAAHVDRYWNHGYVEIDGIRILIRDWESGLSFQLAKAPPSDWLGASVEVTPGCSKLVEVCDLIWDNVANFNGAGSKTASRNPVYETQ